MPPEAAADQPDPGGQVSAEILAIVRHELRTPRAAILGHAQLISRRTERMAGIAERDRRALLRNATAIEAACRALASAIDRLDPDDPLWSAGVRDPSGRPKQ